MTEHNKSRMDIIREEMSIESSAEEKVNASACILSFSLSACILK